METAVMGKTEVPAKIESRRDLFAADQGQITSGQVRHVDVANALVNTGAKFLSLPQRYVQQLGLKYVRTHRSMTTAGTVPRDVYEPVRLTVQGRECVIEVAELPDECPVLIGFFPLELLEFVVDPSGQRLIGNPAHGGENLAEEY
jgi:predicted aspartyl protease